MNISVMCRLCFISFQEQSFVKLESLEYSGFYYLESGTLGTLIKETKFSSYMRKFRWDRLQST